MSGLEPSNLVSTKFLSQASKLLTDYLALTDKGLPVTQLLPPERLGSAFTEGGIPLGLEDEQHAEAPEKLLEAMRLTLQYSTCTSHPLFFNQLYGGPEPAGIAGEWLTVVANTNCHTFEVAPVFTLVETEVLAKLACIIGGPFSNAHDGLFVPGGSIANIYGLHLARNRADPGLKRRGAVGGPRLVAFTSQQAHYSYLKAAALTGLGSDNLVSVACDARGAMRPAALQEAIETAKREGGTPFFVGATAGTTVTGAFDPLEPLAQVCREHEVWLHVDAAWGGAVLLSRKLRQHMAGCDRADSMCWNPHKLLGMPLQCSVFMTRHADILKQTNASGAAYLFQPDKLNAEYDLGDKTIQCGRRPDAYKLWLAWKAYGDAGLERWVDRSAELARAFAKKVEGSQGAFQLVMQEAPFNVCFWWVPRQLRPYRPDQASAADRALLSKVAPAIKEVMQVRGDAMIGFQPLGEIPNFFRIVFAGAKLLKDCNLDALLHRMDGYGQHLFPAQPKTPWHGEDCKGNDKVV